MDSGKMLWIEDVPDEDDDVDDLDALGYAKAWRLYQTGSDPDAAGVREFPYQALSPPPTLPVGYLVGNPQSPHDGPHSTRAWSAQAPAPISSSSPSSSSSSPSSSSPSPSDLALPAPPLPASTVPPVPVPPAPPFLATRSRSSISPPPPSSPPRAVAPALSPTATSISDPSRSAPSPPPPPLVLPLPLPSSSSSAPLPLPPAASQSARAGPGSARSRFFSRDKQGAFTSRSTATLPRTASIPHPKLTASAGDLGLSLSARNPLRMAQAEILNSIGSGSGSGGQGRRNGSARNLVGSSVSGSQSVGWVPESGAESERNRQTPSPPPPERLMNVDENFDLNNTRDRKSRIRSVLPRSVMAAVAHDRSNTDSKDSD
eukprot:TRINITY_DN10321_c0_g1_i1.p1 TRINITY_DN10321_c0_g1~~TRINITY_DN10321_c0_g1_i1.p1  ORF type:complete len:373 (-),score=69.34 TRINITY_DN10321_c0_g1_i1:35-1153(-)